MKRSETIDHHLADETLEMIAEPGAAISGWIAGANPGVTLPVPMVTIFKDFFGNT
jgi:hypothetical protein